MLTGYRRGIEEGATILVKMDGDDQMPVEHLYALIQPVLSGRADYSKANRFVQSSQLQQMPLLRRIGNLGLSFLTKAASGYWNIFDPTNGYTAIDADVCDSIDETQVHRGYFFESSLLIELNLQRAVVVDVDIPARYGEEESSLSILKTLFEFPLHLLRLFVRRTWQRYFVRNFSVASLFLMVGLVLMAFGVIWGAVFWTISIQNRCTCDDRDRDDLGTSDHPGIPARTAVRGLRCAGYPKAGEIAAGRIQEISCRRKCLVRKGLMPG